MSGNKKMNRRPPTERDTRVLAEKIADAIFTDGFGRHWDEIVAEGTNIVFMKESVRRIVGSSLIEYWQEAAAVERQRILRLLHAKLEAGVVAQVVKMIGGENEQE